MAAAPPSGRQHGQQWKDQNIFPLPIIEYGYTTGPAVLDCVRVNGANMLKTWTLERFKSVYDRTQLPMGPLTIFAGVNNSGKSTVIQSILLTAQTLQMPLQERPVALNGHILRLGIFNDIVSSGHEGSSIHVGFSLSDLQVSEIQPRAGQRRLIPQRSWRRAATNVEGISCEFSFSSKGDGQRKEILQLQPNLDTCELRVQQRTEKAPSVEELFLRRRQQTVAEFVELLHLKEVTGQDLRSLEYEVVRSPIAVASHPAYLASGQVVGSSLFHFLPRLLLITYDSVEEHVLQIVKAFTNTPSPWDDELQDEDFQKLPDSFKRMVYEVCETTAEKSAEGARGYMAERVLASLTEFRADFTPDYYRKLLSRLAPSERTVVYQLMAERQDKLTQIARQNAPPEYRTRYLPLPEPLDFAADFVATFFQDYVKYLAPLRDEPKPVYPLSGSTDPTDVGFKGEHTAAVLELNRNRVIEYIRSAEIASPSNEKARTRATLYTAVLDWLSYMGVVSDVSTSDLGKLGHELKVATSGRAYLRDLTHVGVGVSQVLPIVVLALLAERGSTLIFEQPELHLHPRVQSRLADFFLSMTLLGKQCIVETHSEHLINKLRERVASSKGAQLANDIVMYFVAATEGRSTYTPVQITPTGSIKNWPVGFFDEGEELAAGILKAAMIKRKKSGDGE